MIFRFWCVQLWKKKKIPTWSPPSDTCPEWQTCPAPPSCSSPTPCTANPVSPWKAVTVKTSSSSKNRSPCSCLKLIEKCGHHPGVVLSDNAVGFTQLTLVPASNQIYFLTTCLRIHILALAVPMSPTLHIGDNLHLQNLIPRKCSIRIGPLIILETQMWGKTLSDRRWTQRQKIFLTWIASCQSEKLLWYFCFAFSISCCSDSTTSL